MKKDTSKKTEVITCRTSPEVKAKLEQEAAERDWSLSQLVERILATHAAGQNNKTINVSQTININ